MRGVPSAVIAAALVSLIINAGTAAALDMHSGKRLHATGAYTDAIFLAGEEIDASLTTPDDLFAVARDVRADKVQADHVFLAGAEVFVSALQAQDVLAAGGRLTFEGGRVADDVIAAGGRIWLRSDFQVIGSALLTGGTVELDGPVSGELIAAGGTITLNGAVSGNVELSGDRVVIGPNALIGGDLAYAAREIQISPGAMIMGRTIQRPVKSPEAPMRVATAAVAATIAGAVIFALGGALAVLAVATLLPGLLTNTSGRIRAQPLQTLGLGLLVMLGAPAVIGILFVTVVGIPLAAITLVLYLAAAPLALAATVHFLAMAARRRALRGKPLEPAGPGARFGWALLALVGLTLAGLTPLVGGLVWLITFLLGLGAIAVEGRKALANG